MLSRSKNLDGGQDIQVSLVLIKSCLCHGDSCPEHPKPVMSLVLGKPSKRINQYGIKIGKTRTGVDKV